MINGQQTVRFVKIFLKISYHDCKKPPPKRSNRQKATFWGIFVNTWLSTSCDFKDY